MIIYYIIHFINISIFSDFLIFLFFIHNNYYLYSSSSLKKQKERIKKKNILHKLDKLVYLFKHQYTIAKSHFVQ